MMSSQEGLCVSPAGSVDSRGDPWIEGPVCALGIFCN